MFKKIARLTFVSTLLFVFALTLVSASPAWTGNTAYTGSIYQSVIRSPNAYLNALLTHQIDVGYVPNLDAVVRAGYTVSKPVEILGQCFLMTNNRKWPTGTYYGSPNDADYLKAQNFRKALFRLLDVDAIVGLYAHLMNKAKFWLPPGQEKWIEQDPTSPDYSPLPTTDRMAAKTLLDSNGFVEGTHSNPNYKGEAWAAAHWRIDPRTGNDLEKVELLTLGRGTNPSTYESTLMMANWWNKAGIPVRIVPIAFNALVSRLANQDLYDYQMINGMGLVWGSTAPDILYDLTHSGALPLWNFAGQNRSDLDLADETMMSTLDASTMMTAVRNIQKILRDTEPYFPLLLFRDWTAFSGPWGNSRGYLGIVNAKAWGAASCFDSFGKLLGRADRSDNDLMTWGITDDLYTLNPLIAATTLDWSVLSAVTDGLVRLNPYSQKYMAWGADPSFMDYDLAVGYTPKIEAWIGSGRDQIGGDGVYNAAVTYAIDPDTGRSELATYNGKAVADVTASDIQGDDQLGIRTLWKLRDKLYWHDSDPGADGILGTGDDGVTYQVTTADIEFCMNKILIGQENQRYFSNWWFVNNYTAIDTLKFQVYEERQYLFAFEGHGVALLGPKHIYEPDLIGPDNIWGTPDDIHHRFWTGWQTDYMDDMIYSRNGMPGWRLSRLIGFGPYIYHISGPGGIGPGWQPGTLTHIEPNVAYFGTVVPMGPLTGGGTPGRIKRGDIDLNQLVELSDLAAVIDAFGSTPGKPTWDERADVAYPAQIINNDDFDLVVAEFGQTWGPFRPTTIPP